MQNNDFEKVITKPPVVTLLIGLSTSLAVALILQGFINFKLSLNHIFSFDQESLMGAVAKSEIKSKDEPVIEDLKPIETNRIIVKYKDESKIPPGLKLASERANLEKAQGLKHVLSIKGIDAQVYEISEENTPSEVIDRILVTKGGIVEYAEIDMLVPPTFIPNDTYYVNAWHLPKIGMPTVWDTTKGEGVKVAILDSGVNPVPDLQLVGGWNFYDNNSNTSDVYGHGTKVAGAVGALIDNGVGTVGVSPKSTIIPVRVAATDGWATFSDIASGITYAADNGARVANASFRACGASTLDSAGKYMRSKGGVVVIGAGNTGTDLSYPAYSGIICAAATDANDARTSWSSFGNHVDIAAPGAGIWTTTSGGGYSSVSGTSFSSPITGSVYAIMFSVNPELTADEADSILFSTAKDLGATGWDIYYGHGRIDVIKAVEVAKNMKGTLDTEAPSTPQNLISTDLTSNSVSLSWTSATDNILVSGYNLYRNGVKVKTVTTNNVIDTGLNSSTTYSYTVSAFDKAGNESVQSSMISVTTDEASFAISNYSVTNKTSNGANISVNLNKLGTVMVKYGTSANSLNMSVSSTVQSLSHSLNVVNLNSRTTYYYQVVATGQNGEVVNSTISNFKTSSGAKNR